ncbi:FliI/YscN family ATPase [Pleionea sediminis]|uniref:FliI/YscN family ATPase n=1 Tax=Pleionea sediminis TaxID=2569479 RepID=UPI0013DDD77E|nr:FliI/YscN family ATPase [Pleionea sediminis]
MTNLDAKLSNLQLVREIGRVERFVGTIIEVSGLFASVGDFCSILTKSGQQINAEVVAFRDNKLQLMPYSRVTGISFGDEVIKHLTRADIPVSDGLLGRVVDPFMTPLDNIGKIEADDRVPLFPEASNPLNKSRVTKQLRTSVTLLDSALPIGEGQRVGIFAGSGVGKSTLFKVLAQKMEADIRIVVMIGERGREVAELVEDFKKSGAMDSTIIIAASADQPALTRSHALFAATSIAEYFAAKDKKVLLLADSITRHALAQREVGLAVGEPPALRGFPPSVFAQLPSLVERAGNFEKGSITAIYTVLVEGDDLEEPVSDNMRAILDGHIVLSRKLSDKGIYPSIDILKSRSRTMENMFDKLQSGQAEKVRTIVSNYESVKDYIEISGYKTGVDESLDRKVKDYNSYIEWMTKNDGFYEGNVEVLR